MYVVREGGIFHALDVSYWLGEIFDIMTKKCFHEKELDSASTLS